MKRTKRESSYRISRPLKWQLPRVMRRKVDDWVRDHHGPCDCGAPHGQYVCESCDECVCGRCVRYAYWLDGHTILCRTCYGMFSQPEEEPCP